MKQLFTDKFHVMLNVHDWKISIISLRTSSPKENVLRHFLQSFLSWVPPRCLTTGTVLYQAACFPSTWICSQSSENDLLETGHCSYATRCPSLSMPVLSSSVWTGCDLPRDWGSQEGWVGPWATMLAVSRTLWWIKKIRNSSLAYTYVAT